MKGLMFRQMMGADHGMLFIFEQEMPRRFWMKNTFIPLDVAFFTSSGEIIDIKQMTPHDLTSVPSSKPVLYALEMNQGWFKAKNIQIGAILELNKDELKNPQPQ